MTTNSSMMNQYNCCWNCGDFYYAASTKLQGIISIGNMIFNHTTYFHVVVIIDEMCWNQYINTTNYHLALKYLSSTMYTCFTQHIYLEWFVYWHLKPTILLNLVYYWIWNIWGRIEVYNFCSEYLAITALHS